MIDSIEKLKKASLSELRDYAAIPFWSWNNELDEERLLRQIEEMNEAGMGGFIMHARTGLTTEYLGEKWFSCVGACLKKAKELGMNAWIYDENGWPSGFVGGKLLENERYRAQFLRYAVKKEFDGEALAAYIRTENGFRRVSGEVAGAAEYHCVTLHTSPANTDILDPVVVDEFIRLTHEAYYERFADSFGKELAGFFTDEPQYYRAETPFPRTVAKAFEEKYGEDVLDGLAYLFVHDERGYAFREKYYQTLNELYVNNFYKRIYDWCEAHGCKLTGHSVEESLLSTQMWGGAGVMTSYEFEHIPGVDWLGKDCGSGLASKQIGSVASQLGKKQVLTETFGCAGYDITPKELKSIGEGQYFNGVSLMCHHLFPYSLSGQGKLDHPPVFSKHGNWWDGFRAFNDYFTRLGYIVSETKEIYDVLIVHPMRDLYLDYVRGEDYDSVWEIEQSFARLLAELRKNGVLYQFADEQILKKYAHASKDTLVVGQCAYKTVIVPEMKNVSRSTLDALNAYTGRLYVEKTPQYVDGVRENVELCSNVTFEEIVENARFRFRSEDGLAQLTARKGELGEFLFVKNYSNEQSARVQTSGIADGYKALNLHDFERKNIANGFTLAPCESVVLIKDESAKAVEEHGRTRNITDAFAVTATSENYLVSDYAQIGFDGESFGERLPLPQIVERLLRKDYKGKLFVRHAFFLKETMPLKLIMEKGRLLSARVNGKDLSFSESAFDFNFVEADISELVRLGENEFVYEIDYYQHDGVTFALFDPNATESLRNCLYYDTHIENVYIKGEFVLDSEHRLSKKTQEPPVTKELYRHGYPFFKGDLTLEGDYDYDGEGERVLSLSGRFAMAYVFVGENRLLLATETEKEIGKYLTKGKNRLRIVLKSSLRNLFGPHHIAAKSESLGVGPASFTMRGSWGNGVSPSYIEAYRSVPFGVEKIEITEK